MEDANRLLITPKRFEAIISTLVVRNTCHLKARSVVEVFGLDQFRPQLRTLVSPLIPGTCVERLTARHFSIETAMRPPALRFVVVEAVPPA